MGMKVKSVQGFPFNFHSREISQIERMIEQPCIQATHCLNLIYKPTKYSALDKLLGQLGIYATWLSSIAYLQKQLRIFIFFLRHIFFSVITRFHIA